MRYIITLFFFAVLAEPVAAEEINIVCDRYEQQTTGRQLYSKSLGHIFTDGRRHLLLRTSPDPKIQTDMTMVVNDTIKFINEDGSEIHVLLENDTLGFHHYFHIYRNSGKVAHVRSRGENYHETFAYECRRNTKKF